MPTLEKYHFPGFFFFFLNKQISHFHEDIKLSIHVFAFFAEMIQSRF